MLKEKHLFLGWLKYAVVQEHKGTLISSYKDSAAPFLAICEAFLASVFWLFLRSNRRCYLDMPQPKMMPFLDEVTYKYPLIRVTKIIKIDIGFSRQKQF